MTVPTFTATRPRYAPREFGLYSVAEVVTHSDDEWARGEVSWVDWCDRARIWELDCRPEDSPADSPASPGDAEKQISEATLVSAEPFTAYYKPECRAADTTGEADQAAPEVLAATEQVAVEHEFWTNVLDNCQIVGADDCNICTQLGAVEQFLAWTYPGLGVFHIPLWAEAYLAQMLVRDGDRITTLTGTPVVFGAGYFGPPNDAPPIDGGFYIVATGAVRVDRGPVLTVDALDARRNKRVVLSERNVAVGYGCVCVAAPVAACEPVPLPEM